MENKVRITDQRCEDDHSAAVFKNEWNFIRAEKKTDRFFEFI